ncbi:hypothetical protein N7478_009971 [Penicillium angulare]|uniref:uncharacterized protein n=1 Tax=Penicillium angulare TaxID=116970 RepID=UPI00254153EB|nr:uncharacterized protein N7478_009971 [Penicillium angulare]KAJ5267163.1 hypothetical protein N7478_009971 [Penicillium angulare]
MPPKRACDSCISRKVKCNGTWPCNTCRDATKRVACTYLRPPRKRGPKVRRVSHRTKEVEEEDGDGDGDGDGDVESELLNEERDIRQRSRSEGANNHEDLASWSLTPKAPHRISKEVIVPIVRLYQQYSYSVWPVVNAEVLLDQLEDIELEITSHDAGGVSCLVTALCAATMAQLHLAPVMNGAGMADSTTMANACLHIRGRFEVTKEHLNITSLLISFFLHVYHAKVNQRTSAMMFIQEAINGARILQLDQPSRSMAADEVADDLITNRELVFPLLWVSERGYAMHLGLSPSYIDPPCLERLEYSSDVDIHVQGLLDIVKLFVAFDRVSFRRQSNAEASSAAELARTEKRLSTLCLKLADTVSTRTADCHITREWMRTILWQKALSLGLLSSSSGSTVLKFSFPTQVGHDLLHSLRWFSETDLLPLGRDQLLKCFEVANSLADTVLLISVKSQPGFELGSQDFLHALYQKMLPFLEQDNVLKTILRNKTAEALITAPARLLPREIDHFSPNWDVYYEMTEEDEYQDEQMTYQLPRRPSYDILAQQWTTQRGNL